MNFHFLNFSSTENKLSQTLLQRCRPLFLMSATSLIFCRQLVISLFSHTPSIGLITTVPFSHVCLRIKDSCAEWEQSGLTLASTCIPASISSQPRAECIKTMASVLMLSGLSRWLLIYVQSAGWWGLWLARCGCYMEFRFCFQSVCH